jgi:hypothetical protein
MERQLTALTAARLRAPAQPARLLGLTQQVRTCRSLQKQRAASSLMVTCCGALRRLPQAVILVKTVKLAHKKPGTIIFIYSLLLPYISHDTDAQVNRITFRE